MSNNIQAQQEQTRRRRWVFAHITPSLVSEIDHVVENVKTHGKPKYDGRRQFIETAIQKLLDKEVTV